MNRIFHVVWNAARGCLVVASELVGSKKCAGSPAGGSRRRERTPAHGLRPIAAATALVFLMTHGPRMNAAELYWDTNGGSAGLGGTGTWNTSTANRPGATAPRTKPCSRAPQAR
jgi:fibronectin-binding autotransporter adhesin